MRNRLPNELYNLLPASVSNAITNAFKHTNVTSIALSGNRLGTLGAKGLSQALGALQHTNVTSIALSGNGLDTLGAEGLSQALVGLKHTNVTSIDLSWNWLDTLGAEGLSQALDALKHTNVTSIALSWNKLYTLGAEGLSQALDALKHTNVTSIALRGNGLHTLEAEGLSQALDALKHTNVTSIALSGNGLDTLGSDAFVTIFKHLPPHCKTVIMQNDHAFSFPEFYLQNLHYPEYQTKLAERLVQVIEDHMQKSKSAAIEFDTMPTPFEIDDNLLPVLVHALEKQKTAISFLTCGLLLIAQVPVYSEENPPLETVEKMMHDGITFLLKKEVLHNPNLKQTVDFLLWHIRTTNQKANDTDAQPDFFIPSAEGRLAQLAVPTPDGVFNSYSQFGNSESAPNFFTPMPRNNLGTPAAINEESTPTPGDGFGADLNKPEKNGATLANISKRLGTPTF